MIKSVQERVWAFDLEWVPDPLAGRLLRDVPDSRLRRASRWRRCGATGGATEDDPTPFLKTVLCRIVSIAVVERREQRRAGAAAPERCCRCRSDPTSEDERARGEPGRHVPRGARQAPAAAGRLQLAGLRPQDPDPARVSSWACRRPASRAGPTSRGRASTTSRATASGTSTSSRSSAAGARRCRRCTRSRCSRGSPASSTSTATTSRGSGSRAATPRSSRTTRWTRSPRTWSGCASRTSRATSRATSTQREQALVRDAHRARDRRRQAAPPALPRGVGPAHRAGRQALMRAAPWALGAL